MSRKGGTWTVEIYTKMVVALGSFLALIGFVYVHVMLPPDVPAWVFIILLSILGSMLGVDILRDIRTDGSPPNRGPPNQD